MKGSVTLQKKTYLTIGFMGIDGTGKTTQAKLLQKALIENGVHANYFHLFSSQTDLASKATKSSVIDDLISKVDSLSSTNAGAVLELIIRIPGLIFESWVSQNVHKSRNQVIIYDRYFYDKIISTLFSYAKNLDFKVKKNLVYLAKLVSKPTLVFSFQLSPVTAISRKKEHSLKEAEEICELYSQLHRILVVVPINAELSIQEISRQIREAVFSKLQNNEI